MIDTLSDPAEENMYVFNQRFYALGYESSNPFFNVGTGTILLTILIVEIVVMAVMLFCCKCNCRTAQKANEKATSSLDAIFWNGIIRMNIELYIDVMIACMIREITFEWDTPNNKAQTILCMVWLVFSIAFPFIGLCLIMKNRSKL
jgi:hypothetical protein